jgi:hypothetical protein
MFKVGTGVFTLNLEPLNFERPAQVVTLPTESPLNGTRRRAHQNH